MPLCAPAGAHVAKGTAPLFAAQKANIWPLLPYGVDVGRRGWATAANVLNTLPYEDFVREAHVRLRSRR